MGKVKEVCNGFRKFQRDTSRETRSQGVQSWGIFYDKGE